MAMVVGRTDRSREQCAPRPVKGRHGLATCCLRRSKLLPSVECGREREAVMVDTADPVSNLRDLRDSIDNIDAAIVHMLAERFWCTHALGKLKAQHDCPLAIPEGKPSRPAVRGISRLSADSSQTLPRSSSPWSFVKSSGITKRFRAQPPNVYLGMSCRFWACAR